MKRVYKCEYCYLKNARPCYECSACMSGDDHFRPAKLEKKRTTNADRIRAMSDEELAEWLTRIANGDVYTDFCCNPARTVVCDSKCVVCIAECLKHPAKDGDDDD